jgi:hypothetical protein
MDKFLQEGEAPLAVLRTIAEEADLVLITSARAMAWHSKRFGLGPRTGARWIDVDDRYVRGSRDDYVLRCAGGGEINLGALHFDDRLLVDKAFWSHAHEHPLRTAARWIADLERLADLYDRGLLDEQEYRQGKARLLQLPSDPPRADQAPGEPGGATSSVRLPEQPQSRRARRATAPTASTRTRSTV